MPARIRHSPLAAGLSLVDLPILPFLAPRLLQPWPRHLRGRRSQSTAAAPCGSPAAQVITNDNRLPSCDPAAKQLDLARASKAQDSNTRLSDERLRTRKAQFEHFYNNRAIVFRPLLWANDQEEGIGVDNPSTQHLAENIETDSLREHTATDSTTLDNHPPLFGQTKESCQNHLNLPAAADSNCMQPTQDVSIASTEGNMSSSSVAYSPIIGYEEDYFCAESYLEPLYRFMKSDRNVKGTKGGQYFGTKWEYWFKARRFTRTYQRSQFVSEDNRRLVMKQIEAVTNFDPEAGLSSLRIEWMEIPEIIRCQHWPGLMLDTLANRPEHALKFLLATCVSPLPDKFIISDTLDYLVHYHIYRQRISPEDFAVLFDAINDILQQFHYRDIYLSDYAIYHLSLHADRAQTEQLYTTLVAREQKFTRYCQLHLVDRLSRRGATDTAVEVVKTMHLEGAKFTRPDVESVCATLLRSSQRDAEAKVSGPEIFSLLLEYGLKPRVNFYNILAHNAFESGDYETAWKIYDMVIENGIQVSNHTYSIFLNDAKKRMDLGAMQLVVGEIKSRRIRNEYLSTDLLHTMWRTHEWQLQQVVPAKHGLAWKALWQRMLSVYSTYFETGPLEDFAPEHFVFEQETGAEAGNGRQMHPDTPTLNLMIRAALRCSAKQTDLQPLYHRYRRLVAEGHPDFAKVGRVTAVPEAFIMAMGQNPQTLPFCTQVIADMLDTQEQARVEAMVSQIWRE